MQGGTNLLLSRVIASNGSGHPAADLGRRSGIALNKISSRGGGAVNCHFDG